MKTTMTKLIVAAITALSVAVGLTHTGRAQAQTNKPPERIGVYDSRAVAVAFANSAAHNQELREMMAERDKAKSAGDTQKVKKLEAEGKARQIKAHTQAFSTAPVDEYLQYITNEVRQIKKDGGLTMLVSKWDEAELKNHQRAEKVDVTMQLVDAFHPNERSRNWAIDIQKHKPISLEQAQKMDAKE